jgi:hypothetical protein
MHTLIPKDENMHQSNSQPNPAGDPDVAPGRIVDALHDVVSDFDEFVCDWFERLDQSIIACEATPAPAPAPAPAPVEKAPDKQVSKELGELQKEKTRWESTRDSATGEIQDKAELLTEAWLRLESEQRKFLQITSANPHATREIHPAAEAPAREPVAAAPSSKTRGDAAQPQQPIKTESPLPAAAANSNSSREAALLQFQRLRREIDSSRPKSK